MGEPTAPSPQAEPQEQQPGQDRQAPLPKRRRRTFKQWRGARPFWGGLLVTLAGAEILFTEKAAFRVIVHIGMQGLAGYLVPGAALTVAAGALAWVIRRRGAMPAIAAVPSTPPTASASADTASPEEMERLARALSEVED